MLHGPKPTPSRARKLRREMSLPEVLPWRELRKRPSRDATRDQWLRARGMNILRIPAREVLEHFEAVIIHIVAAARGDYPSTAFGGPPPPPGED